MTANSGRTRLFLALSRRLDRHWTSASFPCRRSVSVRLFLSDFPRLADFPDYLQRERGPVSPPPPYPHYLKHVLKNTSCFIPVCKKVATWPQQNGYSFIASSKTSEMTLSGRVSNFSALNTFSADALFHSFLPVKCTNHTICRVFCFAISQFVDTVCHPRSKSIVILATILVRRGIFHFFTSNYLLIAMVLVKPKIHGYRYQRWFLVRERLRNDR